MNQQLTTYIATGKINGITLLFKYDLNGDIKAFEIKRGLLDEKWHLWLFNANNFPSNVQKMEYWKKEERFSNAFTVENVPPDISFEALWQIYNHKQSKLDAEKAFAKLKIEDKIKCFNDIPFYNEQLKRTPGIGKLLLATYINKRRFEDERKGKVIKNINPLILELANSKTHKVNIKE